MFVVQIEEIIRLNFVPMPDPARAGQGGAWTTQDHEKPLVRAYDSGIQLRKQHGAVARENVEHKLFLVKASCGEG